MSTLKLERCRLNQDSDRRGCLQRDVSKAQEIGNTAIEFVTFLAGVDSTLYTLTYDASASPAMDQKNIGIENPMFDPLFRQPLVALSHRIRLKEGRRAFFSDVLCSMSRDEIASMMNKWPSSKATRLLVESIRETFTSLAKEGKQPRMSELSDRVPALKTLVESVTPLRRCYWVRVFHAEFQEREESERLSRTK